MRNSCEDVGPLFLWKLGACDLLTFWKELTPCHGCPVSERLKRCPRSRWRKSSLEAANTQRAWTSTFFSRGSHRPAFSVQPNSDDEMNRSRRERGPCEAPVQGTPGAPRRAAAGQHVCSSEECSAPPVPSAVVIVRGQCAPTRGTDCCSGRRTGPWASEMTDQKDGGNKRGSSHGPE